MNILISGGAGYVGSDLALELLLRGHKVRVLDNLIYKQTPFLPFLLNPNYEFIKGDIRSAVDVDRALKDIDMIIHLAAIVGMPACRQNPEVARDVNVTGTKVINRMRGNIPLIFASTISLYGMTEDICNEDSKLEPTSVYGITKAEAEKEVMSLDNSVSLRFATLFGFSFPERSGYMIINDFVRDAVLNGQLIIYDKEFKRSFVHISDAVDSYIFAIQNFDKMRGQVYNVGSEKMNLSKETIALTIKAKHPYELFFKEGKDEDKRSYFISYDKIRQLGFETQVGLDKGLDELIKGYKIIKNL